MFFLCIAVCLVRGTQNSNDENPKALHAKGPIVATQSLSEALFASGAVDPAVLAEIDRRMGACVLAVSGGRDSMFLLYLFRELVDRGFLQHEPVVFHLNHRLRPEAERDLEFVADEARRLDFAFYFLERDAAAFARRARKSLEEAGRLLRYRALGRLRASQSLSGPVVTAHHADDYLESAMLHLIRGGGPGAMNTLAFFSRVESVPVLRPLVALSRQRITELMIEQGIPFVEDASNESLEFLRNRLRHGPISGLRAEGLDPAKLWRNFHPDPRDLVFPSGGSEGDSSPGSQSPATEPTQLLSIDRRLFFGQRPGLAELKQLFDIALRGVGLPPAGRDFLEALRSQLSPGQGFRLSYSGGGVRIWSDRRGPIWVFRENCAALRAPLFRRLSDLDWELRFNGRTRRYTLQADEAPGCWRPGLRACLADGSRVPIRKLLREAGVPEPVREFLPLILRGDGSVRAICYGFWESLRDRRFSNRA